MDKPYVYALIDTRDDSLFYIGKGVGSRVVDHLKGRTHSPLVQERIAEIRRTGGEPDMRVLCFDTHEQAFAAEAKLIRYVNETQGGLVNRIAGGAGRRPDGTTPSDSYREAQAEKTRANWQNPEYRERVVTALRAALTPASRAASSERVKARFEVEAYRTKIVAPLIKFNKSDRARALRSAQMAARWADPVQRSSMMAAKQRTNADAETMARAASKRKTQWADPVERQRRIDAMLKAHATKWFCVGELRFERATDAAQHFGVSNGTIHNWIKKGKAHVQSRNPAQ